MLLEPNLIYRRFLGFEKSKICGLGEVDFVFLVPTNNKLGNKKLY